MRRLALFMLVLTQSVWAQDYQFPLTKGETWYLTRSYEPAPPTTHSGVDRYALDFTQLGCDAFGKSVKAIGPGIVEVPSESSGYGKHVRVMHPNGDVSLYAHLSGVMVTNGQNVNLNTILGTVGNSGNVAGAACGDHPGTHLHLRLTDSNRNPKRPEPLSGFSGFPSGEPQFAFTIPNVVPFRLVVIDNPGPYPRLVVVDSPPAPTAAIGQLANSTINQHFVNMANEIATAYRIPLTSITAYDNKGGAYVHEWVKNNDRLVVQDILIRNAGLTHERAMLVLAGDGSRAYVVKEGFYWLFVLHNTGMLLGNEQLSQDGVGQVYQRFDRAFAYWDSVNKVLLLKDYAQNVIARYTSSSLTVTIATSGDGTVALDAPAPAPAPAPTPDPVILLANVRLVIQPAESGYRYQLGRGQERMNFVLRLDHTGGNGPLKYEFYDGATLIAAGANSSCEVNLGAGNHAIRARVEAGSGNNLRSSEASQAVLVEAAPKSDWGVPFEAKISAIASAGGYVYIAGAYSSGPNAGKGFLRRVSVSNPGQGESYTFGFSFNKILPRDSYLFAATSSGLMISRDNGANWSTVYSNGQAYDIAILPGDMWNDWPILILVGVDRGVDCGFWTPSEPTNLSNLRLIGSFGPYTLAGGRRNSREWVFVVGSGPSGIQTRKGPYHLAYTNSDGQLRDPYAGRAWTIFASGAELWVALKTNERPGSGGRDLGDNVYYNDDYGGSSYQKARGIPSGDDVVAFGWISGVAGQTAITRQGVLYHSPADRTQWRLIRGVKEELSLDSGAGQTVTGMLNAGQNVIIGTERGVRVLPVSRIATLAAAKPAGEELVSADNTILFENYPNPFNAETILRFRLLEAQAVRLRIYSITGSLVAELVRGTLPAGSHTVTWEGSRYGNGVYLCVLEAGAHRDIRKITLLK